MKISHKHNTHHREIELEGRKSRQKVARVKKRQYKVPISIRCVLDLEERYQRSSLNETFKISLYISFMISALKSSKKIAGGIKISRYAQKGGNRSYKCVMCP